MSETSGQQVDLDIDIDLDIEGRHVSSSSQYPVITFFAINP